MVHHELMTDSDAYVDCVLKTAEEVKSAQSTEVNEILMNAPAYIRQARSASVSTLSSGGIKLPSCIAGFAGAEKSFECLAREEYANKVNTEMLDYMTCTSSMQLTCFAGDECISKGDDPIDFWRSVTQGKAPRIRDGVTCNLLMNGKFSLISRLAKKTLSVPATQTESERVFSHGRRVVDYMRTSLDPNQVFLFLFQQVIKFIKLLKLIFMLL